MQLVRPPIVTILGHVDHGKTTLLDFIRKSSVALKEHGGITQHIGAYQVENDGKLITFIDTPGHAAFEKMRSRGANVADIAVLVLALDDGVMPQTVEAIKHIKQANIPMIVAINKIDLLSRLPSGNERKIALEKIKKQLSDNAVLVEEYGGDVPVVTLSAKTGEGVDKLLEMILLVAQIHEFKADPGADASAIVIESHLDKFKGPVATLLIRDGTLKKGDQLIVGETRGKVRGLIDFNGNSVEKAQPSTPVEVLGLNSVPKVGAVTGEEVVQKAPKPQIASLIDKLKQDQSTTLGIVVKADKQGSLEAIESEVEKLKEGEVVKIISASTGNITESDVKLADATKAIIIGFNVQIAPSTSKLAENEHVLVRNYQIIYELLDELADVIEGMKTSDIFEEVLGTVQILAQFPYGKNETIAGCKVLHGQITKGARLRLLRSEQVIAETKLKSLKKAKEEVGKVEKGEECGMMFDPKVEFQIGDLLESYRKL